MDKNNGKKQVNLRKNGDGIVFADGQPFRESQPEGENEFRDKIQNACSVYIRTRAFIGRLPLIGEKDQRHKLERLAAGVERETRGMQPDVRITPPL